jgi:hypothetical protein
MDILYKRTSILQKPPAFLSLFEHWGMNPSPQNVQTRGKGRTLPRAGAKPHPCLGVKKDFLSYVRSRTFRNIIGTASMIPTVANRSGWVSVRVRTNSGDDSWINCDSDSKKPGWAADQRSVCQQVYPIRPHGS